MSFEPREYLRHVLAESDYLMGRCGGAVVARSPATSAATTAGWDIRGAGPAAGPAPRPPRRLGASTGIHEIWWSRHWISPVDRIEILPVEQFLSQLWDQAI